MEWPGHFTQLPPSLRSHLGMRGTPEELGGAAHPGRSSETDGLQGRPSPPDHRLEELREQTCPRQVAPVRGSTAPCWTRRAEAARGLPVWQVPTPGPWIRREPRNSAGQATPPSDYVRGSGSGQRGATPLGSGAHCALSPDWEWAGAVPSGPQFLRSPSGDRHLHLPGLLCRGGRDLSHPEKSLRLPHPGSFSWDMAVPRAQAWQVWGLEASASGLGPHLEEVGAVGRFQAAGPGGSALSCP